MGSPNSFRKEFEHSSCLSWGSTLRRRLFTSSKGHQQQPRKALGCTEQADGISVLQEPRVKGGELWATTVEEQVALAPDERAGLFSLHREQTRAARSWRG